MPWEKKSTTNQGGLKGRESSARRFGSIKPGFSRPFRPLGDSAFLHRASAFGFSPGLDSAGPLGRVLLEALSRHSRRISNLPPRTPQQGLTPTFERTSAPPGGPTL